MRIIAIGLDGSRVVREIEVRDTLTIKDLNGNESYTVKLTGKNVVEITQIAPTLHILPELEKVIASKYMRQALGL